jgi:hypothetical protein
MATGGGEANTQYILRITDIAQEPLEVLLPIDGYEEMPLVSLEVAVEKLVHLLPRVQTYAHVAKERCKKPNDNLTQDESASIMLYTMEWKPRDKCLYFALNATLRSKDRENLTPWFLYLRLLFNALFRLPSISRTVFRGVKLDLRKKYVKENTIVWWGFSSCTVAMSALQSEVFLGETDVRTMFTIECLNGKDIRKHSYYSSEGEILLLPATQFKVIDSLKQGSLTIIHLQEIVPCFPLLQPVLPSLGKWKQKENIF